uniref:CCHC-type domain-containing protein n=1 Tax=Meloidogyne javanica TaxID=6303 RepID=A0A915MS41_MELJA
MNSGTDHQGMLTRRRIRQLLEDGIEVNLEAMDFINKDRQNGRNAQAKSKSKSLCSEPTHRAEDLQDHSYFENGNVRDSAGLNRNNQNKHSENFVDFRNEDDLLEGEDVVLDDVDQNELIGEPDVGKGGNQKMENNKNRKTYNQNTQRCGQSTNFQKTPHQFETQNQGHTAENQFNRGETFERVPYQQVDLVRGPLQQYSTFNRLEAALILDKIPDIDGREGSDKLRAFFRRFDLGTEEWTDAQRIRALQSKVEGKAERALNAALDSEEINAFGSQSLYAQSHNYYRNDQNRALRIHQPNESQNARAALQWQENRNCYICGRQGHIATYCRERNPGTSNQAKEKVTLTKGNFSQQSMHIVDINGQSIRSYGVVSLPANRRNTSPVDISLHVSTAPFGSNVIVGTNALGALGFKMFDESNLTKIDFEQLDETEEEMTQS